MKRVMFCASCVLICLLIIGSILACAPKTGPSAQPIVLRMSIGAPPEHFGTKLVQDFCNDFNASAGGKYEIKLFPGGVLASTLEQNNALRTGAIDMADAATNFYAGDDAAFSVPDVPFLLNNFDAQVEFTKGAIEVFDKIAQQKFNQKLLIMGIYGSKDIYTANKPVKTLEDWKGLLIAINTPLESEMIKALGAAPVLVDWIDEVPSLQKGVVNGGIISAPMGMGEMHYSDVIKYFTYSGMKGGQNFFAMNLDVWNKMPNDIKDKLMKAALKYRDNFNKVCKEKEEYYLNKLASEGVTIYRLPKAERDRWVNATKQVADNYWNSLPKDIAKKFQDYAAEANKKFPVQ